MKKIKEDVFMKRHNSKCAASIKALIDVAASDDVVTMTFRYKCKEVWESDPSYSDGGFWFLGYVTDSSYFKYNAYANC